MPAVQETIPAFLASVRSLDPETPGGWTYCLDLLSLVEDHREELRHAEWPEGFDQLEAEIYRIMLMKVEDELRRAPMEVLEGKAYADALVFYTGVLQSFFERADVVAERLGGARVH